jgi:hypothetical protein
VNWEEVLAEYRSERIGPVVLKSVQQLCGQIARRYPPTIYASASAWHRSALQDLAQDVVVERLLGEGQLDYIMATARSLPEYERLVIQQIKRCLSRRRRRTIADNLIDRSQRILAETPFQEVPGLSPIRYRLEGEVPENRDPSASELRAVARVVRAVPRDVAGVQNQRAPRVYSNEALVAVLTGIARILESSFSVRDLDEIFRLLLTDLIPTDLEEGDIDQDVQSVAVGNPEEAAVLEDVVERLIGRLTDDQKVILRMKAADVSDAEVATAVGVSRPTLAARKHEVFEIVRSATTDLDDGQREQAVSLALQALVRDL